MKTEHTTHSSLPTSDKSENTTYRHVLYHQALSTTSKTFSDVRTRRCLPREAPVCYIRLWHFVQLCHNEMNHRTQHSCLGSFWSRCVGYVLFILITVCNATTNFESSRAGTIIYQCGRKYNDRLIIHITG